MKFLKNNLPLLLMILFEMVIGIFLLMNPEAFITTIIRIFGILLLAFALISVIRLFRLKKENGKINVPTIILGVLCLASGIICAFFPDWVFGLLTLLHAAAATIFGLLMIIFGVYKCITFIEAKSAKIPVSPFVLFSGLISGLLGVIILLNPFSAGNFIYTFAGISLIVEAIFDIVTLIFVAKLQKETA